MSNFLQEQIDAAHAMLLERAIEQIHEGNSLDAIDVINKVIANLRVTEQPESISSSFVSLPLGRDVQPVNNPKGNA